jgi:hypothetical protein
MAETTEVSGIDGCYKGTKWTGGSTQDMLIDFCEHTDEPALVTRNHPNTKPYINSILHAPCMFQNCLAIYRDVQLSGCYYKVNNVTYIVLWYMLTHTLKVLLQKVPPLFFHVSSFCMLFYARSDKIRRYTKIKKTILTE